MVRAKTAKIDFHCREFVPPDAVPIQWHEASANSHNNKITESKI
jgi:hypothetical protein